MSRRSDLGDRLFAGPSELLVGLIFWIDQHIETYQVTVSTWYRQLRAPL